MTRDVNMKKMLCVVFFGLLIAELEASNSPSSSSTINLNSAAAWNTNEKALEAFIKTSKMQDNSSGVNSDAQKLKQLEEDAAKIISAKIGAKPEELHFVYNATEANNIAIQGVAKKYPGCHLITSKAEHKSVLEVFKSLERQGWTVTYIDVDVHGKVKLDQLAESITQNTKLISIQVVNSEIGSLQEIAAIGKLAKDHGILFHADASQAFCKYPIDVNAMNIDLLTVSGYKIGAPKGIAALYVKDLSKLVPIMFGAGDKLSPGTRSTPLISAFGEAVKNFSFDRKKIQRLFCILSTELKKIDDIAINSENPSHILSVSIKGVLLQDVLEEMKEFAISGGCSCSGIEDSYIMQAIGKTGWCTLRVSFTQQTLDKTLINFAKRLKEIIDKLRKQKSVGEGCNSMDQKNIEQMSELLDKLKKKL